MWIKKKTTATRIKMKSDYTNEYKIRIFSGFITGQKRGVSIKKLCGNPILVQSTQNWPWEKHGKKIKLWPFIFSDKAICWIYWGISCLVLI